MTEKWFQSKENVFPSPLCSLVCTKIVAVTCPQTMAYEAEAGGFQGEIRINLVKFKKQPRNVCPVFILHNRGLFTFLLTVEYSYSSIACTVCLLSSEGQVHLHLY